MTSRVLKELCLRKFGVDFKKFSSQCFIIRNLNTDNF